MIFESCYLWGQHIHDFWKPFSVISYRCNANDCVKYNGIKVWSLSKHVKIVLHDDLFSTVTSSQSLAFIWHCYHAAFMSSKHHSLWYSWNCAVEILKKSNSESISMYSYRTLTKLNPHIAKCGTWMTLVEKCGNLENECHVWIVNNLYQ